MEMREIKKIIQMMKANELTEFEMEDDGFRIAVKRGGVTEPGAAVMSGAPQVIMASSPPQMLPGVPVAPTVASGEPVAEDEDDGLLEINSPIVGTFYRSASPDADVFVTVGQEVNEDTVVCIVEAMKVMNEIKAEVSGVVREILVENATPIEYGQPLFKILPR